LSMDIKLFEFQIKLMVLLIKGGYENYDASR